MTKVVEPAIMSRRLFFGIAFWQIVVVVDWILIGKRIATPIPSTLPFSRAKFWMKIFKWTKLKLNCNKLKCTSMSICWYYIIADYQSLSRVRNNSASSKVNKKLLPFQVHSSKNKIKYILACYFGSKYLSLGPSCGHNNGCIKNFQ